MHGLVQAVFHGAVDQAVRVLHRGHTRQAMLVGQAGELVHAVGRFVRQANRAHLARLDQRGHSLQLIVDGGDGLVLGRVKVGDAERGHMAGGPVDLVEVNHVGFQAFQAVFTGLDDVGPGQVGAAIADPRHAAGRARHLGGQHGLRPGSRGFFKPVAQDGFGRAKGFSPRGD